MKKQILTILSFLFISLSGFAQSQKLSIPLTNPGAPFTLKAGLVYGSIKVSEHEGKEVLVEIDRKQTEFYKDSKEKGGMKRITGSGGLEMEAEEKDNVVEISVPAPTKAVSLSIKIPKGASMVQLSTVNNGNILVDGLSGEIELNNVNGDIKFINISGSIVASTINGNLTGNMTSHKADSPLAFTTLNGNVDVTFPANFKADIKLKSDRGEIYTDFDMETSIQQVNKSKTEGTYKIKLENWVRGKINGGGPEVLMKNMNGNIYVRKAK